MGKRRFAVGVSVLAFAVLAAPAAAQLSTTSSWPQIGHDPGLTRRAFVTGSQTGTPAPGFPAPLYGGSFANTVNFTQAGPPVIYSDGNLLAGTNAGPQQVRPVSNPVAQLGYVNAADVTPPGAGRPLFTDPGPFPTTTGMSDTTPAVDSTGSMFVSSSSGNVWLVNTNGGALPVVGGLAGPPGTVTTVGSPTIGPSGTVYFTAGYSPNGPGPVTGTLYSNNAANSQFNWNVPISAAGTPVAIDGSGNVYVSANGLRSYSATGAPRWTFDPPGPPQVLSPPMIYGSSAFVIAGPAGSSRSGDFLVAVNLGNGRQLWAAPITGAYALSQVGPALGPSGNILALTGQALTAVNKTTGRVSWAYAIPSGLFPGGVAPLVDGSGDTYIFTGGEDISGGTVLAVGPNGKQLWSTGFGFTNGINANPTGATIGLDGTIYVSATDGNVYAFTDPA
jgi:hypothetical protein